MEGSVGELEEVVDQGDEVPSRRTLAMPRRKKTTETPNLLNAAEYRLDDVLTMPVDVPTVLHRRQMLLVRGLVGHSFGQGDLVGAGDHDLAVVPLDAVAAPLTAERVCSRTAMPTPFCHLMRRKVAPMGVHPRKERRAAPAQHRR